MTVAGHRIDRVGRTVASRDVLQSWVSSHARAGRQRPLCEQLGHVRHASGGAALAGPLPRARSPAGERSVRMFWGHDHLPPVLMLWKQCCGSGRATSASCPRSHRRPLGNRFTAVHSESQAPCTLATRASFAHPTSTDTAARCFGRTGDARDPSGQASRWWSGGWRRLPVDLNVVAVGIGTGTTRDPARRTPQRLRHSLQETVAARDARSRHPEAGNRSAAMPAAGRPPAHRATRSNPSALRRITVPSSYRCSVPGSNPKYVASKASRSGVQRTPSDDATGSMGNSTSSSRSHEAARVLAPPGRFPTGRPPACFATPGCD